MFEIEIDPSHQVETTVLLCDTILSWAGERRKAFAAELRNMFREAFPKTSEDDVEACVRYAFTRSRGRFQRLVVLVRNRASRLLALMIFDRGPLLCSERRMTGMYVLLRTIVPEFQGCGMGNALITAVLTYCRPDVLFTTCAQSATLHSWVRLPQKESCSNFEMFPRLGDDNRLITVPPQERAAAIALFKQLYLGVVEGDSTRVELAVSSLTDRMVRKNIYEDMYTFEPWNKDGREDRLANALGLTKYDGILVMLKKKTPAPAAALN